MNTKKLKCWRKAGKDRWVNKKKDKSIMVQTYRGYSQEGLASIQKFDFNKPLNEGGMVQIGKNIYANREEAIKSAKEYMKKHDKC